jgi:sulfate transport system ATP-binding protein
MSIEVRNITRRFDGFTALSDVSLRVDPGQLVALLGPSGSGKTTLLRIIGGLDFPTSGQVLFDDEDASERHAGARGVGFVFQHYALFRHMTVFENVAFGLRVKARRERPPERELRRRVSELLELVQLAGFSHRYPSQLSGGQRQRVALARALAIEPRVLLLDEPFGALDAKVRKELRRWLRELHQEMGLTSIFVTHDQEEALELADRVVVMRAGGIEQDGPPDEIYDRPATPFVYEFLGEVNRLAVTVARGRARLWGQEFPVDEDGGKVERLTRGLAYVRPEDIELVANREPDTVPVRVHGLTTLGPFARVEIEAPGVAAGGRIEVQLSRARARELGLGPNVEVFMRARQVRVFDSDAAEVPAVLDAAGAAGSAGAAHAA